MQLILLPGLDGTGRLFAPLVERLSASLSCSVLSYPPDLPEGYDELQARVRQALPKNEPYVILAESFSGPIGIAIAADPPPQLRGVILCCTFARNPATRVFRLRQLLRCLPVASPPNVILKYSLTGSHASNSLLVDVKRILKSVPSAVIRRRLNAVLDVDVVESLQRIRIPALYLRATKDRLVGADAVETIKRHVRHMETAEFDAPHFLLQVAPEATAGRIRSFCASVE